jgi:RNA polymerase sigma-70 factor (ECF subfamily)
VGTVSEAWEAGRRAWPDVAVDLGRFTAHCAARPEAALDAHAADLYLACACTHHLPRAAEAFMRRFLDGIARALSSFRRGPDFADEVRQLLAVKLLVGHDGAAPRIADYSGHGPLEGWVRVAATRTALDLVRRGSPVVDSDDPEDRLIDRAAAEPEIALLKERYRQVFRTVFAEALRDLPKAERALLRLHHVEGLSLPELAALFRTSRTSTVRRLADAKRALLGTCVARLKARLQLDSGEVDSLLGLMWSQLDLSVARMLVDES